MADAGRVPAPAECVQSERIRVPAGAARDNGGRAAAARRLPIQRLHKDTRPLESEAPAVAMASGSHAEFAIHIRGMALIA